MPSRWRSSIVPGQRRFSILEPHSLPGNVWQEVGGPITVELQILGASAELLTPQNAMALAELLGRAPTMSDPQ